MGNIDSDRIKYWEDLFAETVFGEYAAKLDNLKDAFILGDHSLRCIDEGCSDGVRMAGAGILYQEQAEAALRGKVDGIYSHQECGAAALYASQNGLDESNTDQYGIEWAQKLAQGLGIPYKGHIGINDMARPSGLHIAQVSYYDGSGCFNPDKLDELPAGFVISRNLLDAEYAQKELTVSANIALGSHGLAERFTPAAPFILVPIGNPCDSGLSLQILEQEAEAVAGQFGGRVVVSGFTAPVMS